jgi:sulfane dehydrogenase subunit SoxC
VSKDMSEQTTEKTSRRASRRRFLQAGAALAGGSAISGLNAVGARAQSAGDSGNLPPNVPEWMKAPGDPTGGQL